MSNKNCSIKPKKSKAPARKSRSKTRKPKYLSLRLQLSSKSSHPQHTKNKQKIKIMPPQQQQKQLINLFPLHPENNDNNLVPQDQEQHVHPHHDHDQADHVAFLFQTATDDSSTSLHAILDSTATTSDEGSIPVVPWADLHRSRNGNDDQEEGLSLVKTAMKRCKERDVSEERWVSYCEVVEKKEQEEVSSTTVNCCYGAADTLKKMVMKQMARDDDDDEKMIGLVGLKLDYEEIMNAWSDKGPLYINGGDGDQSPQIVPDLLRASTSLTDGWENVWKVPEMGIRKEKEEEWKIGKREASVLRYKEKRQNRLFSKKIRYQVRKLNAQKRPRFKGRFVKRNEE